MATFYQEIKYLSLENAEYLVGKFEGTGLNEVYSFTEQCESVFSQVEPENHEELFKIIKDRLHWMICNINVSTWDDLKQLLEEAFTPPTDISKWQYILISSSQTCNENVTMYANRFSIIYNYLLHSCTYDKSAEVLRELSSMLKIQAINVFTNGLREPLKKYLNVHRPDSLECAINLALAEEDFHLPHAYVAHMRCYFCKLNGHLAKYCVKNPRLRVFCTFCNEFGHTAKDCMRKILLNNEIVPFVPAAHNQPTVEILCTLCCDNPIDTAIYKCGHMFMCHKCANTQGIYDNTGKCPICRATITEVIKVYK
ncbi:PREDICTED: uncharacterized protein LOC108565735 [Nicrophorus vespilloides]|uniref:Uncharacterized protein LOC108565735 n=1 Tax=Nicrophorus vespilloides TaxID=110193 RepID=A0ABM1N1W6_NICVS|nr:PREDICTED: uncharacterized protein LOC108565735 [Nicrophorus vespilloides]